MSPLNVSGMEVVATDTVSRADVCPACEQQYPRQTDRVVSSWLLLVSNGSSSSGSYILLMNFFSCLRASVLISIICNPDP